MPIIAGNSIDRLITVEMRLASGFPRDLIPRLYDAARAPHGEPLTYRAAQGLAARVHSGDYVLLATGAGGPPHLPAGETDGPVGTAALGRALGLGLGARPVLVAQAHHLEPIRACFEVAGFPLLSDDWVQARRGHCAAWRALSGQRDADTRAYAEMLDIFRPAAVIFVEKLGVNALGVPHTVNGVAVDATEIGHAHVLAGLCRDRGIYTVGIGDGGNEIGFGVIADAVREIHPYGRACRCDCAGGIASVVSTEALVVAAISNWGAAGVAAALAVQLERPDVLHSPEMEGAMLERCVARGGFDGNFAARIPSVDGTGAPVQVSLVTMLGQIVANALRSHDRGF